MPGQESADLAALQAALLPAAVPILPRVAVEARYLLADADSAAGGDWFDAVVRSDGSIGLVVGDVVGHGLSASAVMGQLRTVARHYLESSASPAAVVAAVDRFAARLPAARMATVCVAVLRPDTGAVRYCSAGHPPPLMVTEVGSEFLTASPAAPLTTGAAYAEAGAWMGEGDVLLLYTDGIIERPGTHPVQAGTELAEVAQRVATRWNGPDGLVVQRVCDQTIELLTTTSGHRDDLTLLAVERHAPIGPIALTLPATPVAVTTTRVALDQWLTALRVDDITVTALQHAAGEAVTNAVEHAYRGGPPDAVTVRADLTARGVAEVVVADRGRWREPVEQSYRGLGLAMANELVDEMHIDRRDTGTVLRLRHRLHRPVPVLRGPAVPHRPDTDADEPFVAALTDVDDPDAVLVVRGPVDTTGAAELRDQLLSVTGCGTVSRTVDLSRVTLLASAGVHVLHEARQRSTAHSEELHLLAPRGSAAHHVLELVGLRPTDHV
jgi:anti-sigma regulatory factor (Ser/Thr protein kinase)/anti-anti-sigma regulatory factor